MPSEQEQSPNFYMEKKVYNSQPLDDQLWNKFGEEEHKKEDCESHCSPAFNSGDNYANNDGNNTCGMLGNALSTPSLSTSPSMGAVSGAHQVYIKLEWYYHVCFSKYI